MEKIPEKDNHVKVFNSFQFLRERTIHSILFDPSEVKSKSEEINKNTYLLKKFASPVPKSLDKAFDSSLKKLRLISSGLDTLDEMLNGGIFSSEITEFIGKSTTGKTEIAHRMCANIIASEDNLRKFYSENNNSSDITVIYIDAKGDFSAKKLMYLFKRKIDLYLTPFVLLKLKTDKERAADFLLRKCLSSVRRYCCFFPDDILETLIAIRESTFSAKKVISSRSVQNNEFFIGLRLLIVDGMSQSYYPYTGSIQHKMNVHLSLVYREIRKLSEECNISVVMFNGSRKDNEDCEISSLGNFWIDKPDCRILLTKDEIEAKFTITARVCSSRLLPEPYTCKRFSL